MMEIRLSDLGPYGSALTSGAGAVDGWYTSSKKGGNGQTAAKRKNSKARSKHLAQLQALRAKQR